MRLLLVALFSLVSTAHAESPVLLDSELPGHRQSREQTGTDRNHRMRATGKALTALGVIAFVASIPLGVIGGLDNRCEDCSGHGGDRFVGAAGALTIGAGVLVVSGVSVWALANNRDASRDRPAPRYMMSFDRESNQRERVAGKVTLGLSGVILAASFAWFAADSRGMNVGALTLLAAGGIGTVTGVSLWGHANDRAKAAQLAFGPASLRVVF